ncbi:proteasome assembly chaperone 2-like [Montipora foliosa]
MSRPLAMFISDTDKNDCSANCEEFTLILPAVSIGNVGQLAVDLVISSISDSCCRVGYFYDSCLLPVVGNDALTQSDGSRGKLNVSVEVYKSEDQKIVVVQQRAPLLKGCQTEYCEKLITWIKGCHFKQVILISSINATERIDSQLEGSPLRYLVTPMADHLTTLFNETLSWRALEERSKFPNESEEWFKGKEIFCSGGGLTKTFYEACCREGVSLAVLLAFCSEGDNISDAVNLFLYINDWLKLVPRKEVENKFSGDTSNFRIPPSWSLMFGSPLHHHGSLF